MKISKEFISDVLIIGAGLAGHQALRSCKKNQLQVAFVSSSKRFSGSSFYPGSWGLGLVSPKDKEDEDSFLAKVLEVGDGMCDDALSKELVCNIEHYIQQLCEEGMRVREPENTKDKTLIPCFDDQHRTWRGLLYEEMIRMFTADMQDVAVYEHYDLVELCVKDNTVFGAIFLNEKNEYVCIRCKALILATGGFANLYKYHIPPSDMAGIGHACAYEAGATLKNLEFMQFIPAYNKPIQNIIYNERCFAYARLYTKDKSIFSKYAFDDAQLDRLMKQRAGHGPFTSALEDRIVDIALFQAYKDKESISLVYPLELRKEYEGQMIEDYFLWLKDKGIGQHDTVSILPYFHASNGGIEIDTQARSSIHGVFACGECTTGMHGASRLGGVSTANALVFGRHAGEHASIYAKTHALSNEECIAKPQVYGTMKYTQVIQAIQEVMYSYVSIERKEEGLLEALAKIQDLEKDFVYSEQLKDRKVMHRTKHMLTLAQLIITAVLARKESRGSHYRSDYPKRDEQFQHQIKLCKK